MKYIHLQILFWVLSRDLIYFLIFEKTTKNFNEPRTMEKKQFANSNPEIKLGKIASCK